MAQLVVSAFGSSHDPRVLGSSIGSLLSGESAPPSPSTPSLLPCSWSPSLTLSQIHKILKKNCISESFLGREPRTYKNCIYPMSPLGLPFLIYKIRRSRGAWAAQSVKGPTIDFHSRPQDRGIKPQVALLTLW